MEEKDDIDNKIIEKINNCFSEINSKLNENSSNTEIQEYFLISKSWLEKYLSISKKEKIFKDLIYFMLQKMPINSPKYIYHYNLNNYNYLNNFKIIPTSVLPHFLSIIKNNKNISIEDNNYIPSKIILSSNKIILILEEEMSLEILDRSIKPEYLLCFNKIDEISTDKMIEIYFEEMNSNIPENPGNNIIYDYELNDNIKITIINLEKILEEEKMEKNKISQDNCNKMNQLWENKYKMKMHKQFDLINNKYDKDFHLKINVKANELSKKLQDQAEEQNKIFKDNYNNVVNKINESRINGDSQEIKNIESIQENNDDNKLSIIIDNYFGKKDQDDEKKEENHINNKNTNTNTNNNDYEILKIEQVVRKPLNEENINSILSPILFCLSQLNLLKEYFVEKKESINLYKFVEENTLSEILLNFFDELNEKGIGGDLNEIYSKYSDSFAKSLLMKVEEKKLYDSPGDILSLILQNLDKEQNENNKYIAGYQEESNIKFLNNINKGKTYDIYNENEMLQKFIDEFSINHKTFIYEKFNIILKSSKLCKICNKSSYAFESFPTLNIHLNKGKSLVNENDNDYEMYNALLCKIKFPENISQLLSPSYLSKKVELCKNCNKYNEVLINKNIFLLKEYLIINIDRQNDPKNEMIFIYPEKLDLTSQSSCIINQYQLIGVITKEINERNYNINDVDKNILKYICYFRKQNSNEWICFDESNNLNDLENNNSIFNFKGVSVLIYSKEETE